MFEQLKNWVKPSPATSISEVQKHENELIELFIQQSAVISENPDLPQKVKPQLDNIVFNLKQIDMMKLPIDIQVKIERILTKDIPFALGKELFETASEPKNFIEYSGDHIKALIINPDVIITKVNENLK